MCNLYQRWSHQSSELASYLRRQCPDDIDLCKGTDLCPTGYFSNKAPIWCGTQSLSLSRSFIPDLICQMIACTACDIDMFLFFKTRGDIFALNKSMCGQGSHLSDCDPQSHHALECLTPMRTMEELSVVQGDAPHLPCFLQGWFVDIQISKHPEIQRSSDPEIQRFRDAEIQIQKSSRRISPPQGRVYT